MSTDQIENHWVSGEDRPKFSELERKRMRQTEIVGFLEYVEAMATEYKLDAELAKQVRKSLNTATLKLTDIEDECAVHPDFRRQASSHDFDYFAYAVDLTKGV